MEALAILIVGVVGLIYLSNKNTPKKRAAQELKQKAKFEFGEYIANPAKSVTFILSKNMDVPVDKIMPIFVQNERTLTGVSAICNVIEDQYGQTMHKWKIYTDTAHCEVAGSVAKQISNKY